MRRRRSLWRVAIIGVCFLGLIVAAAFLSRMRWVHPATVKIKSTANLRQIGQSLRLYADEFDAYPPSFDELLMTQDITASCFVNPGWPDTRARGPTTRQVIANLRAGGHLSYVYCGAALAPSAPAGAILAFEATSELSDGGRNFLYADGHVTYQDAETANHAINELAAGHKPPRP